MSKKVERLPLTADTVIRVSCQSCGYAFEFPLRHLNVVVGRTLPSILSKCPVCENFIVKTSNNQTDLNPFVKLAQAITALDDAINDNFKVEYIVTGPADDVEEKGVQGSPKT